MDFLSIKFKDGSVWKINKEVVANIEENIMSVKLEWKKLSETAKQPEKAHEHDAAWDLFADLPDGSMSIAPDSTRVVPTNLAICPPKGWYCDIRGRSGHNSRGKLVILGLVDSDYTGHWGIVVHNSKNETIKVEHHEKIAQFTVQQKHDSELVEVEEFDLSDKERGSKGFGSSGVK